MRHTEMPSKPGIAGQLWYNTLTEHRAEARAEHFNPEQFGLQSVCSCFAAF